MSVSRRQFNLAALTGLSGSLLSFPRAVLAAQASEAPLVLSKDEWACVEQITGLLIPSIDGLGAREANSVNFIDKALANEESAHVDRYKEGIRHLNAHCEAVYSAPFLALESAQQVRVLEQLEDGQLEGLPAMNQQIWFGLLWYHTILGFAAAPRFGGNQNLVGWKVMNFPGHLHEAGGITDAQVAGEQPLKWTFDSH